MKKWLFLIIFIMAAVIGVGWQQIKQADKKYKEAVANIKAYNDEISGLKNDKTAYQVTIQQFKAMNDSISIKLNEARKELGIKDKQLNSMSYVHTVFSRADTIVITDTIFKLYTFELDTVIRNDWYTLRVGLKFPSMIAVKPEFTSEKYIITSTKKETVNPPKKFFLLRWFQKKHTVLKVTVVEKNPYIIEENNRFVEIIK